MSKWTKEQKQAAKTKREALRAAALSMTLNEGMEIPAPSVPVQTDDKLDAILKLMHDFDARLGKVEGSTSQFTPMPRPETTVPDVANTYQPTEEVLKAGMRSMTKDGDTAFGGTRSTDDPAYVQALPPNRRPVFQVGSRVRLNPDAIIPGADGRIWSDIEGSDKVGEVKSLLYIDHTWEPKYKVRIPGVTKNIGSGFRESELLPA